MIKKYLLLLLISFAVLACKKDEELVLEQEKEEVIEYERATESKDIERKPLITITKDDLLRVLVRADGAPGMWADEGGNVFGFYVDLEKMVFEEMDQKYVFVPYTDVGAAAQELKSGVSHVALAVPDLPDYRTFLNLTIQYETLNYLPFVHIEESDISGRISDEILYNLKGKKVGVQVTGFIFQSLREYKDLEVVEYSTTTKAMEGLHNREVDCVFENRETGNYYVKENDWDIKSVGPNMFNHRNTSGFSTALDVSIVDRYNKALKTLLENGKVDELHRKYYGEFAKEYRR